MGAQAAVILALAPAALGAQTLDCQAPQTQIEMTGCAAQAHAKADAALNAAFRLAVAQARRMDAGQPGLTPSNEDMLRDAQRAWIPYRDKACASESTLARGGSMQNQLFYLCLERLTQDRTRDLTLFGEVR